MSVTIGVSGVDPSGHTLVYVPGQPMASSGIPLSTGANGIDPAGNTLVYVPPGVTVTPVGPPVVQGLINNGGLLCTTDATWPTNPASLPAGALWSNGGVCTVNGTTTPNPAAPAVVYGQIGSADLLALGGSNLPLTAAAAGSLILWNNNGLVEIS